jgi:hypothetical protein
MAIGKVNAYATVEAPKADFGAVAQMNIDNLVKSVKEDEQAKAAQKVAADKAKGDRAKDLGLFPELTATGTSSDDSYYFKKAGADRDLYLSYKRDWEENENYDSKAKAETLIGYYKDQNGQLAKQGAIVTKFNELNGGEKLNTDYGDYWSNITQNQNVKYAQDENGVVYMGIYEEQEDGTRKLVDKVKHSDYMTAISNPIKKRDIPNEMKSESASFEKTLNESSANYTIHQGVKKLSKEGLASIDSMAKGKMEDADFMFNYMVSKGIAPDKNAYMKKFDDTKKADLAKMYATEIKGMIGAETTIERKEGWHGFAPDRGSGKGTEYGDPTITNTTGGINFGNLKKDTKGNEYLVNDYSKDASSNLITGLVNKNKKPLIAGVVDIYEGGKVVDKVANARIADILYDKRGKPIVKFEFATSKTTTMSKPEQDTYMEEFMRDNSGATIDQAKAALDSELELSKQTSGEERDYHVQAIGPAQEARIAKDLKGTSVNGVYFREGSVSELRRAAGFDPKKVQGRVKEGEVRGRTVQGKETPAQRAARIASGK